jgi:zinc/manganese transport system ATP-binding protein
MSEILANTAIQCNNITIDHAGTQMPASPLVVLAMSDICIQFNDLTLGYRRHPAVHHLAGAVARGSLTAIVGANGSGKSTLMKGMVGLLQPMAGSLALAPWARVAYLPQQSDLDRTFPARVVDLVTLGLWPRRGLLGRHRHEDREAVRQALQAVGLEGFERRALDTLSGGQLQRTLFARVLVQDANLILLDEPFNAIDARTVADLMALIRRWHGEARTVMVVVHDLDLVREQFPEALLLARRPVAWGDARATLSADNLLRARRFHEAWNENAPRCESDGAGAAVDWSESRAAALSPGDRTLRRKAA